MKNWKQVFFPVAFTLAVLLIQAGRCAAESWWWKGKNIATQPVGQLKNTLLAKSPYLADTVLIAYSQTPTKGNKVVSPGNYKQVIIANSPVNVDVMAAIDNRNLSKGIRQQIDSAQIGISARATLESESSYYTMEKEIAENDLQRIYLTDTTIENGIDSLIDFLLADSRPRTKAVLVDAYLLKQDTVAALITLNQLQPVSEYQNFVSLYSLMLSKDSISALQNDSLVRQQITALANDSLKNGYLSARALLGLLYDEHFPVYMEDFPGNPSAKMGQNENSFPEKENVPAEAALSAPSDFIKAYPNPANNSLTFEYKIQNNSTSFINIYNLIGQSIFAYKITNTVGKVQVDTGVFSSGVYFYTLTVNNNTIAREKLIIINYY